MCVCGRGGGALAHLLPAVPNNVHTTPRHTTPHHATRHRTTPPHTTPHRTTPPHTTPPHTTPPHTTQVRLATFSQHHVDGLDLALTPLAYLARCCPGVKEQDLRSHLGSFGVGQDLALQPMYTLSGERFWVGGRVGLGGWMGASGKVGTGGWGSAGTCWWAHESRADTLSHPPLLPVPTVLLAPPPHLQTHTHARPHTCRRPEEPRRAVQSDVEQAPPAPPG